MKNLLFGFLILLTACKKNMDIPIQNSIPVYVSVKDFGAKGDGISNDDSAFIKTMDAAHQNRLKLYIPFGKYNVSLKLKYDSLEIYGDGKPNISNNQLDSGTVIIGSINCNSKKSITISNLGVQAFGHDGIVGGDGLGMSNLNHTFKNLTLLGGGYGDYTHGLLCQAGGGVKVSNITVANFFHGLAFRCSNVTCDSVLAINCGFTSIVIKSAIGNDITENITIKNITIKGDPYNAYARGGTILVQAFDINSITRNVLIENVNSENAGVSVIGVEQRINATVDNVIVNNVIANKPCDSNIRAAFDINGGSNIKFINCETNYSNGTGYRCSGLTKNVFVLNSKEKGSVVAWEGPFDYLQLNGIEIIK